MNRLCSTVYTLCLISLLHIQNSCVTAASSQVADSFPPLEVAINIQGKSDVTGVYMYQFKQNGGAYYVKDTDFRIQGAQLAAHIYRGEVSGTMMWLIADALNAESVRAFAQIDSLLPPGANAGDGEAAAVWKAYDGEDWVFGQVDIRPAMAVTCGSTIKLTHNGYPTGIDHYLHGFEGVTFGNSRMTVVAGRKNWASNHNNGESSRSYWTITSAFGDVERYGDTCASPGQVIQSGTIVRLKHAATGSWLHSGWHAGHQFRSRQGEPQVSLNRLDTNPPFSDSGDNWVVLVAAKGGGGQWVKGGRVTLKHHNTGNLLYLDRTEFSDRNEIQGSREVVVKAVHGDGVPEAMWAAAEGIYFPDEGDDDPDYSEFPETLVRKLAEERGDRAARQAAAGTPRRHSEL